MSEKRPNGKSSGGPIVVRREHDASVSLSSLTCRAGASNHLASGFHEEKKIADAEPDNETANWWPNVPPVVPITDTQSVSLLRDSQPQNCDLSY